MDPLLAWSRRQQPAIVKLIRELVVCESPSDSPVHVKRLMDVLADAVSDIATCKTTPGGALACRFRLPGRAKKGQVLALGHADTVWPLGTLRTMPFRRAQGRIWGPGVLDMKAGLAFFVFAMRGLGELELAAPHDAVLLVNPDEETGSRASRAGTEALARRSHAVLVLEPGTGPEGKVKTARKGIGFYTLRVRGIASHAGVDFTQGASAVVELARQIETIAWFTDMKRGITVNPGVIAGGTRSNVIAAEATAEIDIRVPRVADAKALERKFRALLPFDPRCSLELSGGLNRPPMERSRGVAALYRAARRLARDMGVTLEESATGGGSDGNFTAALGIPTLDGLGAVGEGAHAAHESIQEDRIADRVALLARLVCEPAISYTA
ncbi:MAG: M20 family metallopeptidase [Acidobacteriota bacterium]|nr:M20 family metallopeptidase [Acidobacteriota bacterium]